MGLSFCVLMALAACGGGGGDADSPADPVVQGGPFEFSRCEVAHQVRIVREQVTQPSGATAWRTQRYVRFGDGPLARVVPEASLPTAKNPEGVISHGPLYAQNCSPGSGTTQRVSLRLRTQGFFATAVGDHLAFGLRAHYPTLNRQGAEQYDGIGMIMHPSFGGVTGERFRRPEGNHVGTSEGGQVPLRDDLVYLIEIAADATTAAFRVTIEATGESTGWREYRQPAEYAPVSGTGLLIAVLCQDDNGRCEAFNQPFSVDVWDIVLSWT